MLGFDVNFYSTILGTLLKLVYLFPFLSYYLILKKSSFVKGLSNKLIIIGLLFGLLNFIMILTINILVFTDVMNPSNADLNSMFIGQSISNVFLIIAYSCLLLGLHRLSKISFDYKELLIFILLISIILLMSNTSIMLSFTILSYVLTTYLLLNNFVLMGYLAKNFNQEKYYLYYVGASLLIIESLIYVKMYLTITTYFPNMNYFYAYRAYMYLTGLIAMIFILIPNIKFLFRLTKKQALVINKSDSLVEQVVKRLFNETQLIYGAVTFNIYKKAFDELGFSFNESLSLKGLKVGEQKRLLKELLSAYVKVLSRELTLSIVGKIINKSNKKLLTDSLKSNNRLND